MNPDNIISAETLHLIEVVVTTRVNLVLLIVGVPLNALNCLVFYRQGLEDRMNLCLFSLAFVDMLNIVFKVRNWWKWQIRKYVRGLHAFALFSSGSLTMVVAVERCICVTWPMKAAHLMKTRTMAAIIALILVTLFLLSLVYLSHYDVVLVTDSTTNQTVLTLVPTKFYADYKAFADFIQTTVLSIFIPFSTFIVVSIATLITVINLRKALTWRQKIASKSSNTSTDCTNCRSQAALGKLLVIVSLIYIVTSTPHVVVGIVRSIVSDFSLHGRYANIFVASHVLYLTLGCLNSTVNFFVYVTRSSKFRR
nr:hypothetical protein BaRGS_013330 [Batillaria attramentaria]